MNNNQPSADSKHTPTPFEVATGGTTGKEIWIFGKDGMTNICQCFGHEAEGLKRPEAEANAAFIVKACNLHEELLHGLEDILNLQHNTAEPEIVLGFALKIAKEVLQKAKQ